MWQALRLVLVLSILFLNIFVASPLSAQQQDDFAGFFAESERLTISSASATRLAELIIPELRPLVERGYIEMVAQQKLPYSLRLDDNWQQMSRQSIKISKLAAEQDLLPGADYSGGLFFDRFDSSKALSSSDGVKALWNSKSIFWSTKAFESQFRLTEVENGQISNEFEGRIARVYSPLIENASKAGFEFRERVSFTRPEFLSLYTWLTYRFYGSRDDLIWIYSPATQAQRIVTPVNRSDSIYKFSISLDDFFTWSGSLKSFRVRKVELFKALAPFSEETQQIERVDGCIKKRSQLLSNDYQGSLRWNFESRRYFEGADWLPTYLRYYLRDLIRVELEPQDPFSSYGRQILYLDAESYLPVYKLVFDLAGNFWKLVMSVYDLGASKEADLKRYLPVFTIVDNLLTPGSTLLEYQDFKYCDNYPADYPPELFDPKSLGPRAEQAPLPEGEASPVPSNSMNTARSQD